VVARRLRGLALEKVALVEAVSVVVTMGS